MADKEVQRNVRSTSEEGIRTPSEKHEIRSSEDTVPFGENTHEEAELKRREELLKKWREREETWHEHHGEEKEGKKE